MLRNIECEKLDDKLREHERLASLPNTPKHKVKHQNLVILYNSIIQVN